MDDLLKQLRAKRPDYDEEAAHHKFLLDSLCGTGGYRGRIGPAPISILGWAADAYAAVMTTPQYVDTVGKTHYDSWLNQFAREDQAKFQARIDVSHYVNYTAPILELLLAYINKEDMNGDGIPQPVQDWMQDADGHGQSWQLLQHEVVRPRAAGLGWCPILFDRPRALEAQDEISVARSKELGLSPRAIPLYPINVLDWQTDDSGELVAVKIRVTYTRRGSLLELPVVEEVYSLWYADRCERYVARTEQGGQPKIVSSETFAHDYGRVPLVIVRAKPATNDKVRGASIIGDVADANRRIFNLDSELDDFLRNSCFPLLGVPVSDQSTSNVGELTGGNGSAVGIPHDSRLPLHFVAPPDSVPAAIEKRREVLVRELYRAARVEFAKPTGVTTSGIARAYEFEQTNRRLGEIAQSFARAEEESLTLVASMMGLGDVELTVTAPADFSVEDLAADLANVTAAIELGVGPTAETELKRRLLRRMLPNLPSETAETIESELTELQAQSEQDAALMREAQTAALQSPETADEADDAEPPESEAEPDEAA